MLVGCYNFKKLTLPYKILLGSILICFIIETINIYFLSSIFYQKLSDLIESILDSLLSYVTLLLIVHKRKIFKKVLIFLLFWFIMVFSEIKIWGLLSLYTEVMYVTIDFFILVNSLNAIVYTLNQKNLNDKSSRFLILIPIMVFCIYYIVEDILLFFLYNQKNQEFFIGLYNVLIILNYLSFISYTLAFIWMPKKEKFL